MSAQKYRVLLSLFIACTSMGMSEDLVICPSMVRNCIEESIQCGRLTTYDEIYNALNRYSALKDAICASYKNELHQSLNPHDGAHIESVTIEKSAEDTAQTLCFASAQQVSIWSQDSEHGKWEKDSFFKINVPSIHLTYARLLNDYRLMVGAYNEKGKFAKLLFFNKDQKAQNPKEPWLGDQKIIIPVVGKIIAAAFSPRGLRCAISSQDSWNESAYHIHFFQKQYALLPDPSEVYQHEGTFPLDERVEDLAWKGEDNLVMRKDANEYRHVRWQHNTISEPCDIVSPDLKAVVDQKPFRLGWHYSKQGSSVGVGYIAPTVETIADYLYHTYLAFKDCDE